MAIRSILIVALYCFSLPLFAQEKLRGIGKFKIGITTIQSVVMEPTKKIVEKYEGIASGKDLVEVIRNAEYPSSSMEIAPYSSDIRVLYSDRYEVSGVELTDLYLIFYKNVLIKIKCNHSDEIIEALTFKYGKPIVKTTRSKPIKCVYKLTGRVADVKTDIRQTTSWINQPVVAMYYYSIRYDINCEGVFHDSFTISDPNKVADLIAVEDVAKKGIEERAKKARENSLKDF